MEHAIRGAPGLPDGDLLWPCLSVKAPYQTACFHLHHLVQAIVFERMGITEREQQSDMRVDACARITGPSLRLACIEHVGYASTYVPGFRVTEDDCSRFGDAQDRSACLFGLTRALASYDRFAEAHQLCTMQSDAQHKRACYEGLFDRLYATNDLDDRACDGSTGPDCRMHLDNFLKNPDDLLTVL